MAIIEELIFRGFIFQNIYWMQVASKRNARIVILCSSFLFAVVHFIGYSANQSSDFLFFVNTFIAGILFCIMYVRTKSILFPFCFHFAWNWAMYVLFWRTETLDISFQFYSRNIIFLTYIDANWLNDLLFGASSGFEGGIICMFILLLLIIIVNKLGRNCGAITKC